MDLPEDWRQQLLRAYPKRSGQGWVRAGQQIERHLQNGESWDEMLVGANNYRKHCARSGEFVRMAQTFFGPNMWWLEFQDDTEAENVITLDDECAAFNIARQPGESDEALKVRLGTAQTKAKYGIA